MLAHLSLHLLSLYLFLLFILYLADLHFSFLTFSKDKLRLCSSSHLSLYFIYFCPYLLFPSFLVLWI